MAATGLEPFQAQLFQALSGELKFEDILRDYSAQAGAVSGVLFSLNRKTGEIVDWTSPELPFGDDAYSQHINSINPRMRFSMAHAPGHVSYESRFISDEAIKTSEFYDWLDREFGMKYFLGSRLFDEGDISVFHSIEFGKSKDAPSRDDIVDFARKAQALGNAWKISKHIRPTVEPLDAQSLTPDYLPWAMFALSAQGRVLAVNKAAAAEIERRDVVALDDTLLASSRRDDPNFRQAILKAINGVRCEVLIRSIGTNAKYVVQTVPVSGHLDVAALVYLWNPNYRNDNVKGVLTGLWKLTAQEAELVLGIVANHSLKDASDALGITRNTGRNHLNSVFSKMEVNSQSEMMKRIYGILG